MTRTLSSAVLMASIAWLLPSAPATAAPDRIEITTVPYIEQGRAPWCVAAATAMVGAHHAREIDVRGLVRQLPMGPGGIAWLDLVEALPGYGLDGFVVTGTEADLRTALAAGHPPIAIMKDGDRTHAVVVVGTGPEGWSVLDPAAPGDRRFDRARFAAAWTGGMVVLTPIHSDRATDLPMVRWQKATARFKAEGWLKRARQRPPTDALALLDRAARADPTHPAVDLQRAAVLGELKRGDEACAAVASARRKAAGAPVVDQVARALSCAAP